MKKIRFIAMLVAAVVGVSLLSSCGSDEPEIKENQVSKGSESAKLVYAGIYDDSKVYSIVITDDPNVDLTKAVGTSSNPIPDNCVAIAIPHDKVGKRIKSASEIEKDDYYWFGVAVNGDFSWFDGSELTNFNGYVDYTKDGVLTVDISATNDYTKVKKLAKESVKVTFKGTPVIGSEFLIED